MVYLQMTDIFKTYRKFTVILAVVGLCSTIVLSGFHHHVHDIENNTHSCSHANCQSDHGYIQDDHDETQITAIAESDNESNCIICLLLNRFQFEKQLSVELVIFAGLVSYSATDSLIAKTCRQSLNFNLRAPPHINS